MRRTVGKCGLGLIAGVSLWIAGGSAALADVASDRAAAMLVWPDILVEDDLDTEIQVTNTSEQTILLHCFYENANSHCSNTGEVCGDEDSSDCFNEGVFGRCRPGWTETDFRVRLTPRQPLGWLASEGLSSFPLTGQPQSVGPDGSSNAGSLIPPVPEPIFSGVLRCIALNDDGTPSDRNVLVGHQTFIDTEGFPESIDIAKANAIGQQAIPGALNDDNELILGGPEAEYNGCANFLIVNHFFDLGENPVTGDEMETTLVLVPCSNDYLRQVPGNAVVQYIVYNEFEQRFSTSRSVDCKFVSELSEIDTTDSERSIFSAGVAGTLTGQSRLNPLGGGLLGIANEELDESETSSEFNIHYQGDRAEPDRIIIP